MNETYARGDTYAGDNAYGRDATYAREDAYAEDYGQGDAYAGDNGRGDAHGRDDGLAADDAYGGGQRPARRNAYAREQQYVWRDPRAKRGDGKKRTGTAGGYIIAFVALFSAVVVIVGLGYATQAGERRRVLLAEGDCVPVASLNTRGLDCTLETQLAQQYEQMIAPVNQQMNTYVAAYAASEQQNLAAAEGVLTGELAEENSLASSLKQFTFPPVFSAATNKLTADNEALIKLTAQQVRSPTLVQLQSFDGRVQADMSAVRVDLTLVGKDLAKHPTPNEYIGNGG
jgi:hypothetical protein